MTSEPNKRVNSAKELDVYKLAYELAMTIFEISKGFPPEERFALTTDSAFIAIGSSEFA